MVKADLHAGAVRLFVTNFSPCPAKPSPHSPTPQGRGGLRQINLSQVAAWPRALRVAMMLCKKSDRRTDSGGHRGRQPPPPDGPLPDARLRKPVGDRKVDEAAVNMQSTVDQGNAVLAAQQAHPPGLGNPTRIGADLVDSGTSMFRTRNAPRWSSASIPCPASPKLPISPAFCLAASLARAREARSQIVDLAGMEQGFRNQ